MSFTQAKSLSEMHICGYWSILWWDTYIMLSLSISHHVPLSTLDDPDLGAQWHLIWESSLIVSVVTIHLEFEFMDWQGHVIRCSALVNNKYHWSQEEGWVAMVQHQITANRPLQSKPSAPQSGNMSLLLLRHAGFTEILTEQRDGKGEWGEKASREWEKNARIKWIKRC